VIWLIVVAALVVLLSGASIYGSYDTWRDMRSGRPTFDSLADYTGIVDRAALERLAGRPGPDGRYDLPFERASALPQRAWKKVFDWPAWDLMTLLGAISAAAIALTGTERLLPVAILVPCAIYQVVSYVIAVIVVTKHLEASR
jgi:hypothetical protein